MNRLNRGVRRLLLLPVCAMVGIVACKSTVDLTEIPTTFVDPGNYFKTPKEAITATNGIYTQLMTWDNWIDPAWQETTCEGIDLSCPNWWAWGGDGPGPGKWFAGRTWTANFAVVRRANDVLGALATSQLDPVLVTRLKGEAHFLRGYAYFELVRRYGQVPLRVNPYESDGTYGEIARASIADVYKQIVTDLKAAATELPSDYASKTYTTSDRGRPIAASAQGLLAKAYLTAAGKEANLGAVYNDSARKAAQVVMSAGNIKLETDYMKNFDWQAQVSSSEVLWQIGATHQENTGPELGNFFNPNDYKLNGGGAGGTIMMRTPFYETYEAGDLRVKPGYSIFDSWADGSSSTAPGTPTWFAGAVPDTLKPKLAAATQTGWTWSDGGSCDTNGVNFYKLPAGNTVGVTPRVFTTKYIDRVATTKSQNSTNPVVLRYADVLLTFAEAENEVTGPTPAVFAAINQVRTRANLKNLEVVQPGLTQAALREAVWLERRHEFFAEFQEWFDLKRQGRWLQAMNNQIPLYPGAKNPSTSTCRPRRAFQQLLPIPDAEIGANKLITQNPGY
ncbi:MAG: RagB/SusD family nutrient uptake outer membrane protein [Gemmatimonadaceae bacterium]